MDLYLFFWGLGCVAGVISALVVLHVRRALTVWTVAAVVLALIGLLVGAKWHARLELFPVLQALTIQRGELTDPGYRLPLGILTGAVLAGVWCLAVRAPWRETGDALAIAACVLIGVGRLGCINVGCCVGAVCSRWGLFCHVYPPNSLTYLEQVDRELIPPTAAASLPAHPLPVYFMVGALLLLVVLLTMLRRGAAPGTLLLVFALVHPTTKLFLETFRGLPREPVLMIGIPAVQLACGVIGASAWSMRRWRRSPRSRRLLGNAA